MTSLSSVTVLNRWVASTKANPLRRTPMSGPPASLSFLEQSKKGGDEGEGIKAYIFNVILRVIFGIDIAL